MLNLNQRSKKIFEALLAHPQGITGEELAQRLNVSSRTIRSDIKKVQEALRGYQSYIESAPNRGYRLYSVENSQELLKNLFAKKDKGLENADGRKDYIIGRLLECDFEDYAITQMELADEMFLSLSTLKAQLNLTKEQLSKYSLEIAQYKTEGIRLKGKEEDFRYCILEYLNKYPEHRLYEKIFLDIGKERLDIMLQSVLNMRNLQLSDTAKSNLCVQAALMMQRSKLNKVVSYSMSVVQNLEENFEYSIAKEIIKEIFRQTSLDVSYSEIYYITRCLLTSQRITAKGDFVNKEHVKNLVKKILQEIKDELSLDFTDDEFLADGLSLHLSIAIARVTFHMSIRNELLESIKNDYPLAFQMGILAGKIVKEIDQIEFNENEIGYMALHFGAAIARSGIKEGRSQKTVVVVCSAGLGVAVLLKAKIEEHFRDRLKVVKVIPKYEVNRDLLDEVDFVFTTVPLERMTSSKIIRINHMLKKDDILKIEKIVFRKHLLSAEGIEQFFDESNFYINKDFSTREECLNFLTDQAIERGLMSENTKKSVFEREKLSTTAIGEWTAIPHPIYNDMDKSSISVLILNKPINWDETMEVQVIFLLNVKRDRGAFWENVFLKLYHYIKDQNGIHSMLTKKSYAVFLNEFLKCFNDS